MASVQEALDRKRQEAAAQAEQEAKAAKEAQQLDQQQQSAEQTALSENLRKQQEEDAAYNKKEQDEAAARERQAVDDEQVKKLEASRLEQEEQDRKDELAARLAAAQELLKEHGLTPATTPNAGGNTYPTLTEKADGTLLEVAAPKITPISGAMRTFQHLYAGAGVIMPTGKRLVFGGQNGGIGYYTTNRTNEIELLSDLADTPGSMVSEVKVTPDGRMVVTTDPILQAEQLAVQQDARRNTAADLNPQVSNARENLARTIAQNS